MANKVLYIQFETGEGIMTHGAVNFLLGELDGLRVYAEIPFSEDGTDDYGYLTLKEAVLEKAALTGISTRGWSFQYDGQETILNPDAHADNVSVYVDIQTGISDNVNPGVLPTARKEDLTAGDTVIIAVEIANSCFGLSAKFWKGESVEGQTDLKHAVDEMYRLTEYYKNTCGKQAVFVTRSKEEED